MVPWDGHSKGTPTGLHRGRFVKPRLAGCDRPDLLAFEEVSRRLGLRTRLPVGRREVAVDDIIGSVGRVTDFDGCFRPRTAKLRREIAVRAADPPVVDMPIALLQVDHAYFVEDGHKRLSIAIAAGRIAVDADVDRFETELHLARGATMASIRATGRERRFRKVTGLDGALPGCRFPLSDPDDYLELEESVKAHTLDVSRAEGRLLGSEEGARHWYDTVFAPVMDIIDGIDGDRLLGSMTDADRFLLFRRGIDASMGHDWSIPPRIIERGMENVRAGRRGWRGRLAPTSRIAARRRVPLLPAEEAPASGDMD
jgi:hypothetical protein